MNEGSNCIHHHVFLQQFSSPVALCSLLSLLFLMIVRTFFPVPSFAPSGLTVEEANDITFNVSWRPLPRNESNGVITDYEVSNGYTSQKRRRRADSRPDVQTKTSKTWILLTGLASCRKYSIKVRAYTSVGPGPYTDPQTRTTAGERSLCRNGPCECLEEGAWALVLSFPLTHDVIHSAICPTWPHCRDVPVDPRDQPQMEKAGAIRWGRGDLHGSLRLLVLLLLFLFQPLPILREWNSINWISAFINAVPTPSDLLPFSSQIEWKGSKSYNTSFREDHKKTYSASELQRKVSGLTPDTEYEFQVSAKSSCGEGVFSNTARGTTAKDGERICSVFDISHLLQVIWWFVTVMFDL